MTNEEAIELLSECYGCKYIYKGECMSESKCFEAKQKAIIALYKQIPKKPKKQEDDCGNIECVCAICKARLIPYDAEYCAYCGQKIYWEE